MPMSSLWLNREITEEELLRNIAYYKARLVDIQNAPPHSRHREGWADTRERLEQCQRRLAELRRRRRFTGS